MDYTDKKIHLQYGPQASFRMCKKEDTCPILLGVQGLSMITLIVFSLAVLFALLTISPLLVNEDACAYLTGEFEPGDETQSQSNTDGLVFPVGMPLPAGDSLD